MNRNMLCITAGIILFTCGCQNEPHQKVADLILTNQSELDLKEHPVIVKRGEISSPEALEFTVIINEAGDTIPSQLDDRDGDGEWDELFFLANMQAGTSATYHLYSSDSSQKYENRTYVRFGVRAAMDDTVKPATKDTFYNNELPGVMGYQPYQTDGPSWENDKVGFRHYLDGRNSKDVFGKKVSYMSPANVGINKDGVTEDNYHVMEDWGRDILSVGTSVGIGGYSLLIDSTLVRLGVTQRDSINNVKTTEFQVMSSGPVRSVMNYRYNDWQPEGTGRSYQVKETTEIWPGMYAYKNTIRFDGLQGDEKAVIGLVNINTEKKLQKMEVGDFIVLFTHDKQTYEKEWFLGLGLLIPKNIFEGTTEAPSTGQLTDSFLAKVNISEKKDLSYYAVAAWELSEPRFAHESDFKEYIRTLAEQLSSKILVKIN